MRVELNDRYLRSLVPPDTGRIEVSDTKRRGLRLRLYARKDAASTPRAVWMYEKRVRGGPKRKHTLGTWPAVSLSEARSVALEIEAEASQGIDRVALQQEEANNPAQKTVAQVLDTYDKLHLSQLRTQAERKRQLEQSFASHMEKPISELSRGDLQEAIDDKVRAGRKAYANRIRSALLAFSRWAWTRGYIEADIGSGIPKAMVERPRERVPSVSEVRQIWQASFELGKLWGPVIRLILLTGQRRGEILELRWSEVDFEKAVMIKPGSKTKNKKPHTTHLSPPAFNELKQLYEGVGESDLVFSTTGKTAASGIGKAKRRLDVILGDDFEPWRLHDVRTGFASALAEAGESEAVVDRILNHAASGSAPSAVARVYNQAELLPQRAKALDLWASILTQVP